MKGDNLNVILTKLKNDSDYYGTYGKKWLSNSDIYSLLNDPKSFRQEQKTTKAMIEGSYLHTAMLEPEKLESFQIVDMASRNSKLYKEAVFESKEDILLLQSEVDNIQKCIDAMKGNLDFCDAIYESGNLFEVPRIQNILGQEFKGKADIVSVNSERLIDIKTTSNIKDFKYSAKKYNYDSQAYIYQCLFDMPLSFYVVDKTTHQLGVFDPSADFLMRGKEKVQQAIEIYTKFYSDGGLEDIDQYIAYETL
tara:strand:- start:2308 stop:3060 length:753 start_codon:yes stop_codon:yes gene_type:complete